MAENPKTETSSDLQGCAREAQDAARCAAAWAEATAQFPHNAHVAARFAAEAHQAAKVAAAAARLARRLAKASPDDPEAARTQEAAQVAAQVATLAAERARAAQPCTPATGDLADLCQTRQQAVFAWLSCPGELDHAVQRAVLRARMEEAEAAVQAALSVSTIVS